MASRAFVFAHVTAMEHAKHSHAYIDASAGKVTCNAYATE